MHRLHLLRHAKSDRDQPVDDKERCLSRRGRDDARRVGENLSDAIGPIDLLLCSSALRTRETAALVLAGFTVPPRTLYEDALYLAGPARLMRRLQGLDEAVGAVLVIGHNPGLHELAVALAASDSPAYRTLADGKFPTTARASFTVAGAWAGLGRANHQLIGYVTPKMLGRRD